MVTCGLLGLQSTFEEGHHKRGVHALLDTLFGECKQDGRRLGYCPALHLGNLRKHMATAHGVACISALCIAINIQ